MSRRGRVGPPGLSAYQIAVVHGFTGDEEDWLRSIGGLPGSSAGTYLLVTTNKLLITTNKIKLPSRPYGDILFNIMLVFDQNNILTEYDGITITQVGSDYYAILNEPDEIIGNAVVTYLTREAI